MGSVFVVDDDEDVCAAIADLIANMSQQPCLRLGGLAELVKLGARALACELAIIDINLGAGAPTGIDVYDWLRGHGFRGRIVFLTGHAHGHPLVKRACALGHAQVVQKPIEVDELRAIVLDRGVDVLANASS
jgi:FixJ family two-component response regulator